MAIYNQIFIRSYLKTAIRLTNAHLSKGMSYYSDKYKVCIGGFPDDNSRFYILD